MNTKNASIRLVFAIASTLTTVITLGSVVSLAEHYSQSSQLAAARPVVMAQR